MLPREGVWSPPGPPPATGTASRPASSSAQARPQPGSRAPRGTRARCTMCHGEHIAVDAERSARPARRTTPAADDRRILYEIIRTVSSSVDLDHVLAAIVRLVTEGTQAHAAYVFIVESGGSAPGAARGLGAVRARGRQRLDAPRRGARRLGRRAPPAGVHPGQRARRPAHQVLPGARGGEVPVDRVRAADRQGRRGDRRDRAARRGAARLQRGRRGLRDPLRLARGQRDRERPPLRSAPAARVRELRAPVGALGMSISARRHRWTSCCRTSPTQALALLRGRQRARLPASSAERPAAARASAPTRRRRAVDPRPAELGARAAPRRPPRRDGPARWRRRSRAARRARPRSPCRCRPTAS